MAELDCSSGACKITPAKKEEENTLLTLYNRINKLEATVTEKDKLIADLRIDRMRQTDATPCEFAPESTYEGLRVKYHVYNAATGTYLNDCFVLRPEKDPAALRALTAYAQYCGNTKLAKDINKWVRSIYDAQSKDIAKR